MFWILKPSYIFVYTVVVWFCHPVGKKNDKLIAKKMMPLSWEQEVVAKSIKESKSIEESALEKNVANAIIRNNSPKNVANAIIIS